MLEILALIGLTKTIGKIVEGKGYKSGGYKLLTVLMWFGGEILGAIIGAMVAEGGESAQCLTYLFALAGAGLGAFGAYSIANSLTAIGPSLEGTGTASMPRLPIPAIILFWIIISVVANISWSAVFSPFGSSVVSGITAGLIAGLLQWFILLTVIPNANRGFLAIWIPVTAAGWTIAAILYSVLPLEATTAVYFLVAIVNGLLLGGLQWLILQRFSKAALWWIPASLAEAALAWLFGQVAFSLLSSLTLFNILFGVLGSIFTAITLVLIFRRTLADVKAVSNQPMSLQ